MFVGLEVFPRRTHLLEWDKALPRPTPGGVKMLKATLTPDSQTDTHTDRLIWTVLQASRDSQDSQTDRQTDIVMETVHQVSREVCNIVKH